jgi:hypothetical protein
MEVQSVEVSGKPEQPAVSPSTFGWNVARVIWPTGFTGVRTTGGEVAVVDGKGNLVAVTGRTYQLQGKLTASAAAQYPETLRYEAFAVCVDGLPKTAAG